MAKKTDKNKPVMVPQEQELSAQDLRLLKLDNYIRGTSNKKPVNIAQISPVLPKDSRSVLKPACRPLSDRLVDGGAVLDPNVVWLKAERENDYVGTFYGHTGMLRPEYDLLEPYTIYDTEAYVRQAIARRKSLMFRNGFDWVGENDNFVQYLERRVDQISFMMRTTFDNFLKDVLTNLLLCSNCIILKIRKEDSSGGKKSERNNNRIPVAAYKIIPAHTMFPVMDKGVLKNWRRYFDTGKPFKEYPVADVIHFKWDVKPGHFFGTPRLVGVRDDIYALRRLEENIELLLMNHLFPMFHVKVGNELAPATFHPSGISEVDIIKQQIESMPKEGVFVTDERAEINAVGAQGKSLDPSPFLKHYKQRVFTGLGVSSLDMGESDTANRSTADNVSQNLKDTVKADLDNFTGQVLMFIAKELFEEASFSISVQAAVADVRLVSHEIDMDGKIKDENHTMNLFNNHLITHSEARNKLKKKPLSDEEHETDTHFGKHIIRLARETAAAKAAAIGGKKGASAKAKVPRTASQPANQHGTNPGPTKAKSSKSLVGHLYDTLVGIKAELEESASLDTTNWKQASSMAIDTAIDEVLPSLSLGDSYTNQIRAGLTHLKLAVGETTDSEMLYVLLENAINSGENTDVKEIESTSRTGESGSEGTSGRSHQEPGPSDSQEFDEGPLGAE